MLVVRERDNVYSCETAYSKLRQLSSTVFDIFVSWYGESKTGAEKHDEIGGLVLTSVTVVSAWYVRVLLSDTSKSHTFPPPSLLLIASHQRKRVPRNYLGFQEIMYWTSWPDMGCSFMLLCTSLFFITLDWPLLLYFFLRQELCKPSYFIGKLLLYGWFGDEARGCNKFV